MNCPNCNHEIDLHEHDADLHEQWESLRKINMEEHDAEIRDEEKAKIMRALNVTLDAVGAPQDEWPCNRISKLTEKVRKPLVEALERMFQVHILHCRICAGPDDGCDEGQRLEQIKLAVLAQCKQP